MRQDVLEEATPLVHPERSKAKFEEPGKQQTVEWLRAGVKRGLDAKKGEQTRRHGRRGREKEGEPGRRKGQNRQPKQAARGARRGARAKKN